MRDPRAALAHVLTTPLAINEQWIELFKGYASNPKAFFDIVSDGKQTQESQDIPGVHVVSVTGPLSKEDDAWSWLFGGTSYASIRRELEQSLETGLPIVMRFDTPGGDVYGCDELAQFIRDQRAAGAKIDAYIEGQGDSAGYYLASACGNITINASGEAGSIGVRCVLVDTSKYEEQLGIKVIDVVADQSPLKVIDASDPKDVERVKQQMTAFATVFVAAVAEGRGVSVATVLSRFGKGDVMVGEAAVAAGLADEVGTLDSVIAALTDQTKGKHMSVNKGAATAAAATPAANMSNGKCNKCSMSMSGSDEIYCESCMEDNDDGDAAKGFRASVLALLGVDNVADAVGKIAGMKAQASKVDALEGQIAAIRKEQAQAEAKGVLDAACADGRVTPAARGDFESLYAEHGIKALSAALKVLKPAATPAIPATDEQAAAAAAARTAPAAASGQYSEEALKMLKLVGVEPDAAAVHKAKLRKTYFDQTADAKK